MRRGLRLFATTVVFATSAVASTSDQEDQDQNCGPLIFEITRILATKPTLETDARVALGASLEYLFLHLQRSKTKASTTALASTAVLKLDAGGAESRTEAILSKGPPMLMALTKVQAGYQHLCAPPAVAVVCRSQDEAVKYIEDLRRSLSRRSAPSK
jgi:hypothetical protein